MSKAGEPKRPLLLMEYQCLVEQTDEKETDEKPSEEPEEQLGDVENNTEDTEMDKISVIDELTELSEPDSKKSEKRLRKTSSDMDVEESAEEAAAGSEDNSMPELNLESEALEPETSPNKRGRPRKKTFSSEPPPLDEVPMLCDEPTSDFLNETSVPPPFEEDDALPFSQADFERVSRSRLLSPIQNRSADHGSDSSLSASTGVSYSGYIRKLMFSRR
ncbi:unnamed protein product [Oikopleura dioica]|uniref:Uncharacterized protein n=2 Tax=Oikopleura dioica TaxID=34765 RepID=E4YIZ0_OIKDI|nr:unnamed protein product [Oikopleura dioica]